MSKLIISLFLLVVLAVALSFSVINSHTVVLHYYLGSIELPLAVLLAFTLAIGALLGMLAMMKKVMGLKMEVARLRRMVRVSEQEAENLRSLPAVKSA